MFDIRNRLPDLYFNEPRFRVMNQVESFIAAIRESVDNASHIYTHGGCYDFYLILKAKFKSAEAYYDSDHVITKIGSKYYDINGEIAIGRHLLIDDHTRFIEGKNWG